MTAEMIISETMGFADVELVAAGAAAEYAADSPLLRRIPQRTVDHLESGYDLLVSVLEPRSLVWAYKNRLRAVSVDNIYWHWRWTKGIAALAQIALDDQDSDVAATIAKLKALGQYAEYTPLYLAAERVIWQRIAPRNTLLPTAFQRKALRVEPLLPQVGQVPKRSQILVSLSGGLLNPVASRKDWETYLEIVAGVTRRGLETAGFMGWNIVVAAPKALREMATDAFGVTAESFGHRAFLKVLSESRMIAAPKGLSTTVEAVAAETTLFTLPEFHDGNALNYWGFGEATGLKSTEFAKVFPAAQLTPPSVAALAIADLFAAYTRELEEPIGGFVNRGSKLFAAFVDSCASEPVRLAATRRQHGAFMRVARGFAGLAQVVEVLQAELTAAMAADTEMRRSE